MQSAMCNRCATKNDHDEDDWKWMILMIESLKKTFLTKPELCRWMTRKAGLLKSVLHEVDKNLRGYDATLYDLFKYPFVSYDVDACKNGSSSSQTEHSWFPTCLVTSPFENTFFFKTWCIHYALAKSKRKWFSMQNC